MPRTYKKILKEVLSLPTAPFHEHAVIGYVARLCLKNGLKMRQDSSGNIFISYKRGRGNQPIAFMAHMDHPGFEIVRSSGVKAEAGLLGGVNPDHFRRAKIVAITPKGLVKGKVLRQIPKKKWYDAPVFEIGLQSPVAKGDFGYFDLPLIQFRKKKIYTKAADNLIGTSLLLNLLLKLKKSGAWADVKVVLTRAEEVGFIGCLAAVRKKSLGRIRPLIVLETSDAKKGRVAIHGGPVVRVGDAQSSFDPALDLWMSSVAEDLATKKKDFKFQRALLAGGRCEASALVFEGYHVGGLATPLGNYHNNGGRAAVPEYVRLDDYQNMLTLLYHLARGPKIKEIVVKRRRQILNYYRRWKTFLKVTER